MKRTKCIIIIAIGVLAIIGTFIGVFVYKTRLQAVKLDTSVSPDKQYEIVLYSVGEPIFRSVMPTEKLFY